MLNPQFLLQFVRNPENMLSTLSSRPSRPPLQVCPSEIKRVTSAGGCVLWGRVQGCLAVSRAFGDKALHPYVIAEPFISARPLNLDQVRVNGVGKCRIWG